MRISFPWIVVVTGFLVLHGLGCRLPYCFEKVEPDRDYRVVLGPRLEHAQKWGSQWIERDLPPDYACSEVDGLGPGVTLDARIGGVIPGNACDAALVRVRSDVGVSLGEAERGGSIGPSRLFAGAHHRLALADGCPGDWMLELNPVSDSSDPFQEIDASAPGLIVSRTFVADTLHERCAARAARKAPLSCGDAWAAKLERL